MMKALLIAIVVILIFVLAVLEDISHKLNDKQ